MKITIKNQRLFDWSFIIIAALLFIAAVYFPPVHGVADQGDFERVMIPAGLNFIDRALHNFYGFIEQRYALHFTYRHDAWLYIPRLLAIVPATSFIYPITLAKLLCMFGGVFDTRTLAAVMCTGYIAACVCLLRRLRTGTTLIDFIMYALTLLIFFDGVTLTLFNSLYGQSMMTLAFVIFILAAVIVIQNFDRLCRAHLLFLFFGCILLLGAKLQCIVFLPLLIIMWLYILHHTRLRRWTIFLLCFTIWYGASGYIFSSHNLNEDTQYNSVFYGILKDSPDPQSDLKDLGLSPALAADAGKHAYLDASEYAYSPHSPELKTEFYDKMSNLTLVRFYLTHPSRLVLGMEKTAQHAFYNQIDLGTLSASSGYPEGTTNYRCAWWSAIVKILPHDLLLITGVYLLWLAGGLYEAIRYRNRYAYLFLLILAMGALQFPMPYLGNGNADITKQLYLFNEIFYFGILVSVIYAVNRLHDYILTRQYVYQ